MSLSVVFNELSLEPLCETVDDARSRLERFIKTLQLAVQHGLRSFRTLREFKEFLLADDYPVAKWLNDNAVSREHRTYLRSFASKYPVIQPPLEDHDDDNETKVRSSRFLSFHGTEELDAEGLGYAYLLGVPAISLSSQTCWDCTSVDIRCIEMITDTEERDYVDEVMHVSDILHFDSDFMEWVEAVRKRAFEDGASVVGAFPTDWPHLILCDNARKQLLDLKPGDRHLRRIVERLDDLEQFVQTWNEPFFDIGRFQSASGESVQTMNQFTQDRTFISPDGITRVFEHHLKGLPDVWRIHIWADTHAEFGRSESGNRKILIGYVGPHLPTVNDRT